MDILSKVSERLKELMFDKGVTAPELAQAVGVGSNTITRYLQGNHIPNFNTFVALIEYFHCSADFLLGKNEQPLYEKAFLPLPAFSQQFRAVMQACGITQYALQKDTKISWNNFHHWLSGKRLPYPDSLLKLADAMDISVDYLLGRIL